MVVQEAKHVHEPVGHTLGDEDRRLQLVRARLSVGSRYVESNDP